VNPRGERIRYPSCSASSGTARQNLLPRPHLSIILRPKKTPVLLFCPQTAPAMIGASLEPYLLPAALSLTLLAFFLVLRLSGVKGGKPEEQEVPGPLSHPLLANTREVLENLPRFLDWLYEGSLKYGGDGLGTWRFKVKISVGFVPHVVPSVAVGGVSGASGWWLPAHMAS
jgi:hypothetical protein